jgi:tetratricopeptide (TPR) repeat protein
MAKVRHLSATARPGTGNTGASTLEGSDPALAAALMLAKASPTADRNRAVADMYRDRGVLDAAFRHYNRALTANPRDAGAYEGLARIWRDWGLPHLAVGDAHRAAFYAPHSASAQNTFGTIMQALGRYADAKSAYELASWLDPKAAYAANNLCYLSFLQGRIDAAVDACTVALELDPSLAAARNNLALAYAANGRMDLARTYFLDGDRASGLYNTGIAYLAAGDDNNALAAFDAASRARPTLNMARERAEQIRARLFRSTNFTERTAGAPGQ